MMKDLIIIGAGPAGLYAGYLAGLKSIDACILESADQYGGQLRLVYPEKIIYDIPGFKEIKAVDFVEKLFAQYQTYQSKISLDLDQKAISITKKANGYLVSTHNQEILTKSILITNGGGTFEPRKIEFTHPNIFYFMQDSVDLINLDVVILGGGDSAIDYALMIQDSVKSLTIVHRRNDFRAHPGSLEKLGKHVKILKPFKVLDIDNHEIKLANGDVLKTLHFDKLFVFYGSVKGKSKLSIFGDDHFETLKVNSNMQTKHEFIYAAGNVCSYEGKLNVIASAFGEVSTAIGMIADMLYPMRNNHEYSSLRRGE